MNAIHANLVVTLQSALVLCAPLASFLHLSTAPMHVRIAVRGWWQRDRGRLLVSPVLLVSIPQTRNLLNVSSWKVLKFFDWDWRLYEVRERQGEHGRRHVSL